MRKVKIFDTTLRDGEQTPGVNLSIEEKITIAKNLEELNVDVIEAGFAIASQADFDAIKEVAKTIKKCKVASLARATVKDIDRAWDAVKEAKHPRIHTFIATSDIHMKYKLKMSEDEVYNQAVEMVKYAKSKGCEVQFSCEDASRTRAEFLYRVLEGVIDAGAVVVNIPDTVGFTYPEEFYEIIKGIKENVPNIDKAEIAVHCHNDLGLATANALAAIRAGAEQIECTVNGLGERAGNTAIEELAMTLKVRPEGYEAECGINHSKIYHVSKTVSKLTGVDIQPNKAVVGENAFAHESGIHQHGVLENSSTYEIMTPESIGRTKNKLVFGKHSGKHAFKDKLIELGYELSDEKIDDIFKKFKKLTDIKKEILDEDIESLALGGLRTVEKSYDLTSFNIIRVPGHTTQAEVKMVAKSEIRTAIAEGDGPVSAVYNAINTITGCKNCTLKDYSIKSITSASDAQGEARVEVEIDGKVYIGKGIKTDIIEASAIAYIDAINRSLINANK
ncbi:2-isopropylmalate synthase [uncultured Ilyobacter sp.]|uniref:2-isopropylmalate synthase n=1 Tax=uncultured Ilyobacter sp. TaxID=544433 RepID=UPI0029BFB8F4|nr:2-isopropylmalate synthase [uncultured Ilyobacter sp.]